MARALARRQPTPPRPLSAARLSWRRMVLQVLMEAFGIVATPVQLTTICSVDRALDEGRMGAAHTTLTRRGVWHHPRTGHIIGPRGFARVLRAPAAACQAAVSAVLLAEDEMAKSLHLEPVPPPELEVVWALACVLGEFPSLVQVARALFQAEMRNTFYERPRDALRDGARAADLMTQLIGYQPKSLRLPGDRATHFFQLSTRDFACLWLIGEDEAQRVMDRVNAAYGARAQAAAGSAEGGGG